MTDLLGLAMSSPVELDWTTRPPSRLSFAGTGGCVAAPAGALGCWGGAGAAPLLPQVKGPPSLPERIGEAA